MRRLCPNVPASRPLGYDPPKHTLASDRPFTRKIFSVQKYSFGEMSEVLEKSILGKPKLTRRSPRYLPEIFIKY